MSLYELNFNINIAKCNPLLSKTVLKAVLQMNESEIFRPARTGLIVTSTASLFPHKQRGSVLPFLYEAPTVLKCY